MRKYVSTSCQIRTRPRRARSRNLPRPAWLFMHLRPVLGERLVCLLLQHLPEVMPGRLKRHYYLHVCHHRFRSQIFSTYGSACQSSYVIAGGMTHHGRLAQAQVVAAKAASWPRSWPAGTTDPWLCLRMQCAGS